MESLAKKFDFCEEDLELDFNQLGHIQIICDRAVTLLLLYRS